MPLNSTSPIWSSLPNIFTTLRFVVGFLGILPSSVLRVSRHVIVYTPLLPLLLLLLLLLPPVAILMLVLGGVVM